MVPPPPTDDMLFAEDEEQSHPAARATPETYWKILVVDDEESIHHVTDLVLGRFELMDRQVQLIHAYSAAEAKIQLQDHPDIALILLDVIMETDQAGLDLVHYIRDTLHNKTVRILMRTGQAGTGAYSSENELIRQFQFNDFRNKAELSSQELKSAVISLLKAYEDLTSDWKIPWQAHSQALPEQWKILIVDDDEEVIKITQFFLQSFEFEGKKIEILRAASVLEAQQLLKTHPEISVLIVDMALTEGDLAGIVLADTIRQEYGNHLIQILLRSGREAPVDKPTLIRNHGINDFRFKTELPFVRLDTVICSLLRTYQDLMISRQSGS